MGKIGVGSLKPNKVKADKKTEHVSGHMPTGSQFGFGNRHA
jgi:hypothetical protein